jgi:ABC-type transporter Mla subunit MlaD
MKHKVILITALSVAALICGCNKDETTSQQLEKAKTETKEAAQDLKDYTYAQKQEFVQQMQTRLNALNQELDQVSAKVEGSSDAVKAEAKPKLQALRDQAKQLSKQLDDVKGSSESTWDSVKAGAEKAFEGLTNGVYQARQWVSNKVAP